MKLKWKTVGDEDELTLDGDILKEVPEVVKDAIDFFKQNGVETIEADLLGDDYTFYRDGVMDHIPLNSFSAPGRKARESIKSFMASKR